VKRRLVIAGASAAAVAIGFTLHPLASVLVLPVAAGALTLTQRQLRRLRRGMKGEEVVTSFLGGLPDDYLLVNDVVLPGHRGNIDHVLVGPCGVVVIETKQYGGVVSCRRDQWFANGRPIKNITRQVIGGATAVREFLRKKHPDIRGRALGWVDAIVVFADPLCRLELDRPTPTGARVAELLAVIRVKAEPPRLTPPAVKSLAESLAWGARVAEPVLLLGARR
jgi:hypothetical protein